MSQIVIKCLKLSQNGFLLDFIKKPIDGVFVNIFPNFNLNFDFHRKMRLFRMIFKRCAKLQISFRF